MGQDGLLEELKYILKHLFQPLLNLVMREATQKLPNEHCHNLSSNDSKFGIKDFFRWGADFTSNQSKT